MFFLISLVVSKNYCVGNGRDPCYEICKDFNVTFDYIYPEIPRNYLFEDDSNEIHKIYIAKNTSYYESNHTIIFCDPSIYLEYRHFESLTITKDNIIIDSETKLRNYPMIFYPGSTNTIDINVQADGNSSVIPFILNADDATRTLNVYFYYDYTPENLISISDSSNMIIINHMNDKVAKLFANSDKLSVLDLTYYCISDKETKCEGFDNYSLQYINSTEEITDYPLVLIVDSSIPQILINIKSFTHVIGLPGSDITFYNDFNNLFINSDSIEATNFYFEGQGNLTIAFLSNFSIILTTQTNNFNLTFKNTEFHQLDKSHIYSFNEDIDFEFENKIRISDYSLFKGPNRLSGLFEKGKYLSEDEFVFYNVTVENLKEYDYKYVTYYFKEGDHEIPKTWKNRCRFQGINPNKTNFIFSDVYSYNGQLIDGFIDVNIFPSSQYNMITIKPAKIFQLDSFKDIVYNYEYAEKYTILVDHDFIMNGTIKSKAFDMDEMSHDQCKIVGEGTISFLDERFMNYTRELCTIDDTVHLKLLDTKLPNYYVCVGQENAEKCKAEIALSDSIRDSQCFWIRNLATRSCIYNYQELFITDKRDVLYGHLFPRSVLTANACVTVEFYRLDSFYMYKDGFNEAVIAQNRSAKLIILFYPEYSSYKGYVHKDVLKILCHGLPTEIIMLFYLNYESIQLNIMWIENYTQNTIHFGGKARIYIRKHIESMIDVFERPDSVVFSINYDHNYYYIFVSDKPIQYWAYYNYVLCKNSEELMEYDRLGNAVVIYIYKNISLFFDSYKYRCKTFKVKMFDYIGTQNTNIVLPSDSTMFFTWNGFDISTDKNNYYQFFNFIGNNFIINIKERINLRFVNQLLDDLSIEFNTSHDSIEIFPSRSMTSLIGQKIIKIDDNISIFSPAPLYIDGLFGSHPVNYSKDWIYYHFSEEGKALYGSHPSIPFDSLGNDENLPEKFVLAVGNGDNLTIPTNLKKSHDIFIYQISYFRINEPLNLTYYNDGIVFNEKVKIICGNLDVIAKPAFEINSEIDCYSKLLNTFYFAMLNLTLNPHTNVSIGHIKRKYYQLNNEVKIFYLTSRVINNLTFYVDTDYELGCLYYMKDVINLTYKYHVAYDYICYYRYSYGIESKCPGYVLHSSDITSLLTSIVEYPKLDVLVAQDMILPYPTGNHFVLMPYCESIMFDLPSAPYLMTISNEKTVNFNYSDSTYIEILNKSIINLRLMDDFKLLVDSNSDSTFTFTLESDAFISAELNDKKANFSISVVNNSYHLYTDDLNQFGNIKIDSLELYYRICACDSNKSSYCNFPKSDTFENIFNENYYFNVAEIVLTSNSKDIKLPSILYPTFVNILTISMAKLTLSPVSDLEVNNESVIVNEFWNFRGDLKVLTLKLDIVSSLSVDEQISVPITFQMTGEQSYIDLRDFDEQVSPKITILKHVNDNSSNINNLITVFGKNESYYNFINNIVNHDGISILLNGSSKYLCICKDDKSCNECKEGVDGLIDDILAKMSKSEFFQIMKFHQKFSQMIMMSTSTMVVI